MSVDKEIERTARRLEELKKRKANKQKTVAMQFFKKNKIEDLLEMPEVLQAFTKEITGVIKKYQQEKIVTGEPPKEVVQDEWNSW